MLLISGDGIERLDRASCRRAGAHRSCCPAGALAVESKTMTVQTFRELLAQRPFAPFRLVMSSGQSYEVRHPEMAWLTGTSILVGIDQTDEGVPAEFKICSLPYVATIEPLSTPSAEAR
jgi:hypothetical protein